MCLPCTSFCCFLLLFWLNALFNCCIVNGGDRCINELLENVILASDRLVHLHVGSNLKNRQLNAVLFLFTKETYFDPLTKMNGFGAITKNPPQSF